MVDLYEDFLTDADVKDIGEYVHSKIGTFIWRPSFAWGDINKGSSNCNSLPMHPDILMYVYKKFKELYPDLITLKNFQCFFHSWNHYSLLRTHDDGPYNLGATIYLNREEWDVDWGGLFYYLEKDEIKIIKPKYKRAVVLKGGIKHGVTTLNYFAPIRCTLQIFVDKEKVDNEK